MLLGKGIQIVKRGPLVVLAFLLGATVCLMPVSSARAESDSETSGGVHANAKVPMGDVNAEVNAGAAADPIKACGASPKDKDSSRWGKYFRVNGVNIRQSPSINSRICAQGQKSHTVDYHCYTVGSDGYTWTYLRDATTHYAGWVRDNLLVGYGSLVHC
jgi:hypothetical protein